MWDLVFGVRDGSGRQTPAFRCCLVLSPPLPPASPPSHSQPKQHRFYAMTGKGNIQCQAFNYSCFRLLASLPDGHMESVLLHCKASGVQPVVHALGTW